MDAIQEDVIQVANLLLNHFLRVKKYKQWDRTENPPFLKIEIKDISGQR